MPTPLHADWIPTADACARLRVNRRTLQRWASAGRILARQGADGRTLYQVAALPPAATGAAPSPATSRPATAGVAPRDNAAPDAVRELVRELADSLRAAHVAELERADAVRIAAELREELAAATARAEHAERIAADLAERLIRRGELVRRLAARAPVNPQ